MAETQKPTPEETDTLTRAAAATAASLDLPSSETRLLLALTDRLVLGIGYAEADAAEARAELARFAAPIYGLSSLPAETLRGWRFSAEAALSLIAQGNDTFDPRPMLECLQTCITEIERLVLELATRDRVLSDLEARMAGIETAQAQQALDSDSSTPAPQPPISDAFNSDETPPEFRGLDPEPTTLEQRVHDAVARGEVDPVDSDLFAG